VQKLYWDTSVFLCFLNSEEEDRRKICEDILQNARKGEVEIHTSTFTIVEAIRPKAIRDTRLLTPEQIAAIEAKFKWRWLKKIDVDARVAAKAVDLARQNLLKPADAVHAASAILHKVDVLQRWDRDFNAVSGLIAVEDPQWMTQQISWLDPPTIGPMPPLIKLS